MKIMAYNILEGGNLSKGDRTDLLLKVIRGVDPDILGLCECRGFDDNDNDETRLQFFCRELGMSAEMNRSGSGNHVALLFKKDLRVLSTTGRSHAMYNGWTRIIIDNESAGRIAIVMAHLNPFSSSSRVAEAETLAARAAVAPQAVIMGDMNNIAPTDLPVDLSGAPPTLTERLKGPSGEIDPSPIQVLLSRGFIDLGSSRATSTYPTRLVSEQFDRRVRLDYIFASPRLAERATQFSVEGNETALRASDHLPVIAELDLS